MVSQEWRAIASRISLSWYPIHHNVRNTCIQNPLLSRRLNRTCHSQYENAIHSMKGPLRVTSQGQAKSLEKQKHKTKTKNKNMRESWMRSTWYILTSDEWFRLLINEILTFYSLICIAGTCGLRMKTTKEQGGALTRDPTCSYKKKNRERRLSTMLGDSVRIQWSRPHSMISPPYNYLPRKLAAQTHLHSSIFKYARGNTSQL